MMYVADHGESLGENNIYLHGLPYAIAPDVQKHVPWISWLSNDFHRKPKKLNPVCLKTQTNKKLSHDNYFHSGARFDGYSKSTSTNQNWIFLHLA